MPLLAPMRIPKIQRRWGASRRTRKVRTLGEPLLLALLFAVSLRIPLSHTTCQSVLLSCGLPCLLPSLASSTRLWDEVLVFVEWGTYELCMCKHACIYVQIYLCFCKYTYRLCLDVCICICTCTYMYRLYRSKRVLMTLGIGA